MAAAQDERLCVGVIAGAHGVRGLVKIKSFTADPANLTAYGALTDESGALVERTTQTTSLARPTDDEIEMARAVIFADPDLSELYERANNPEISGGFVLQREAGPPCGPGSRCLQFDMFDVDVVARRVHRIRYVVVDVRDGTLVSKDFDPSADGNATRFNGNPNPIQ